MSQATKNRETSRLLESLRLQTLDETGTEVNPKVWTVKQSKLSAFSYIVQETCH